MSGTGKNRGGSMAKRGTMNTRSRDHLAIEILKLEELGNGR